MDIRVRIDGEERDIESADAQWFHQAVNSRTSAGVSPCIQVMIVGGGINLRLATRNCSHAGGGRLPNPEERALVDIWKHFGLDEDAPNVELAWPFLMRLRAVLGLRAA